MATPILTVELKQMSYTTIFQLYLPMRINVIPYYRQWSIPDISPLNIDPVGVQKLLKDLDAYKAPGPDNIPPRLLKDTADLMAPLLTLIFQASLYQGLVPDDWKKANVVLWHRKGPRNSPGNYRPISLTSICCKTLEHVIYSCIFSHLNRHNVLCDNQHGFHSKWSCETQLLG